MDTWRKSFKIDPLPPLLDSGNVAVQYFARRDLLGESVDPVSQLWQLPEAQKILRKQQTDGSWPRSGEHKHPAINYGLIETWRWFRYLVDQYGFTREQSQVQQAAEFLFSCQADAGDFRGILANQYATYYSGAILSLLIKAGYVDDPRIERGFQWLLAHTPERSRLDDSHDHPQARSPDAVSPVQRIRRADSNPIGRSRSRTTRPA